MKIKPLILIDTAIIGGPGRGIFQLLKVLTEQSISYLLCNFEYNRAKSNEFLNAAKANQVAISSLRQRSKYDPRPIWQLLKIAKAGKYTLIQSHGYKSHFLAAIAAFLLNLPWVAFAHGWTAEDRKVKLYHKLDQFLLRYASVVVAVSPQLTRLFSQVRGRFKPTEQILNAIDSEALPGRRGGGAIREQCGANTETVLIGCFGRLSFEKGQDILLQEFSRIHNDFPNARLLILGDGPDQVALKTLCQDLELDKKVRFMAHDSNVRDYYEAIDLLVLPSRSEGLPNVILEAMAFSVPVVASNVGAVQEIVIENINGWAFSPTDKHALSRLLSRVLSDPSNLKRIGSAARESLVPKFCPMARAKRIIKLYQRVCKY